MIPRVGFADSLRATRTNHELPTTRPITAHKLVERALAGDAPPGFQTPAKAYGPHFALELPGVSLEEP